MTATPHRTIQNLINRSEDNTLLITYATVNPLSTTGSKERLLRFLRSGTVSETPYGRANDMTPGWWAVNTDVLPDNWDDEAKFYRTDRFRDAVVANPARAAAGTVVQPEQWSLQSARGSPDRAASPRRSRSHSRSRSRSRSHSPAL
jgi:hypothetical protein